MWVRGCLFYLIAVSTAWADEPLIDVPSGQPVILSEVLVDDVGAQSWVRFRFIAPQIARSMGGITFADAGPDMEALCAEVALTYIAHWSLEADKVVISLSDRAVPFGQANPAATQFFEAFAVKDGACVWEEF